MASAAIIPRSRKKILVTDDNQVVLTTLSLALKADGYEVATALNGAETVRRVNLRPMRAFSRSFARWMRISATRRRYNERRRTPISRFPWVAKRLQSAAEAQVEVRTRCKNGSTATEETLD